MAQESFEAAARRVRDSLKQIESALDQGILDTNTEFTYLTERLNNEREKRRSALLARPFTREDHKAKWSTDVRAIALEHMADAKCGAEKRPNEGISLTTADGTEILVLRPDADGRLPAAASEARAAWYEVNSTDVELTDIVEDNNVPTLWTELSRLASISGPSSPLRKLVVLWDYTEAGGLWMRLAAPKNREGGTYFDRRLDMVALFDDAAPPAEDGDDLDLVQDDRRRDKDDL